MNTKRDEALEWLWQARSQIARQFDYDPKKAAAHYRRKQKRLGVRIYRRPAEMAPAK
jgi:hypothetical protein